jgi:hypothetical protein
MAYLPVLARDFNNASYYRAISPLNAKPLKMVLRDDMEVSLLQDIITSAIETFVDIETRKIQVKWDLNFSLITADMRFCLLENALLPHVQKKGREDFAALLDTILSEARCNDVRAITGDEMFKQFLSQLKDPKKPIAAAIRLGKFVFNPLKFMLLLTAVVDVTKQNKASMLRRDLAHQRSIFIDASVTAQLNTLVAVEPPKKNKQPQAISDIYRLCKLVRNRYAHIMSRNHVRKSLSLLNAQDQSRGVVIRKLIGFAEQAAPGFQYSLFSTAVKYLPHNTSLQQCF